MQPTTLQALGQTRLAELHRQSRRDALARAARRARRQQSGYPRPAVLAAVAAWARRPRPAPESS